MSEAQQLAMQITRALPRIKTGALRFWGQWFGRPYDNSHRIVRCDAELDIIRIHFDEAETLTVWSPRRYVATENEFRISDADRVRWEWFYYGAPRTAENHKFKDYKRVQDVVELTTNWSLSETKPTLASPAVEIPDFQARHSLD